jgi:hypothetical protein
MPKARVYLWFCYRTDAPAVTKSGITGMITMAPTNRTSIINRINSSMAAGSRGSAAYKAPIQACFVVPKRHVSEAVALVRAI